MIESRFTIISFGWVTESNDDDKATAALIETLDLLETDQIPSHQEDLRMIRCILRMDDLRVSEIMKPRPDIIAA